MIAVVQRVSTSSVRVNGEIVGEIGRGLNILLGVRKGDTADDVLKLAAKIIHLRIFPDDAGKMNLSLLDIDGEALVISQFTLAGSVKKGRRPSFDSSADPEDAETLYEMFVSALRKEVEKVQTGRFGAMMDVAIRNDGPVTFIVDSKELG